MPRRRGHGPIGLSRAAREYFRLATPLPLHAHSALSKHTRAPPPAPPPFRTAFHGVWRPGDLRRGPLAQRIRAVARLARAKRLVSDEVRPCAGHGYCPSLVDGPCRAARTAWNSRRTAELDVGKNGADRRREEHRGGDTENWIEDIANSPEEAWGTEPVPTMQSCAAGQSQLDGDTMEESVLAVRRRDSSVLRTGAVLTDDEVLRDEQRKRRRSCDKEHLGVGSPTSRVFKESVIGGDQGLVAVHEIRRQVILDVETDDESDGERSDLCQEHLEEVVGVVHVTGRRNMALNRPSWGREEGLGQGLPRSCGRSSHSSSVQKHIEAGVGNTSCSSSPPRLLQRPKLPFTADSDRLVLSQLTQ